MNRQPLLFKLKRFCLLTLVVLLLTGVLPVGAQDILVDEDIPLEEIKPDNLQQMPQDFEMLPGSASANLGGSGPTDDFGYTWDDSPPLDWIDATLGVNTGMSGNSPGKVFGPVDLGFDFPYYENVLSEVFIAGSGYISFTESDTWPGQSQIPTPGEPNNVIAPYWAPFYLSPHNTAGQVYYLQGGSEPERYFVVEWFEVTGYRPDDFTSRDDLYHFQVILYENGDFRFQYKQMIFSSTSYCGATGIENASGEDGLAYQPFCSPLPSEHTVLFLRPEPTARVSVTPTYQSEFIHPGSSLSFPLWISNLGNLGEDTFELSASANWPLMFFGSNGVTPLDDTNADGSIDTGSILPGETLQVIVKLTAPDGLSIGAGDQPEVTVSSALDPDKTKTVMLQAAVPARFAQVFRDDADGAMRLFLAQPNGTQVKEATSTAWWGYNPAVIETASGDFLYLWQRWRFQDALQTYLSEIELTRVNYAGETVTPPLRLTDHSTATLETHDEEPVIAVADDDKIGLAWRRRILRPGPVGVQENWNVYFAVLDRDGSLRYGPVNLTDNILWYPGYPAPDGSPRFWNIRLAADGDRFALTWRQESHEPPGAACTSNCVLDDIYFSVWHSDGAPIKPVTPITADSLAPLEGYTAPVVTPLVGARWLVAYSYMPGGMVFTVLDENGELVFPNSFIPGSGYGWSTVASQLPESDRAVIVWTAWTGSNPQIHLALLDTSTYQIVSGPSVLSNPAATTGGDYASLAADAQGNTILTWMDFNASSRRHLYYALLGGQGQMLTSPMIFHSADNEVNGHPHIETGFSGYSSTSNRQFMDVGLDSNAAGWIERLYDTRITTGCQANPPLYCPQQTVSRAQMAIFLERGMRGADYVPPLSDLIFIDVTRAQFGITADWIARLYLDGITAGCQASPLKYCPLAPVTRAQMAKFLLLAKYGQDYDPGDVPESGTGFADVDPGDSFAPWIYQLAAEGITSGCGGGNFCPDQTLTRAQMAVFLVRAFDLP